MSYESYCRYVDAEKISGMPERIMIIIERMIMVEMIMMMVMMKMILMMTIAEVGRWRENAEYALMIQTHSHPYLLLHPLKSQC